MGLVLAGIGPSLPLLNQFQVTLSPKVIFEAALAPSWQQVRRDLPVNRVLEMVGVAPRRRRGDCGDGRGNRG